MNKFVIKPEYPTEPLTPSNIVVEINGIVVAGITHFGFDIDTANHDRIVVNLGLAVSELEITGAQPEIKKVQIEPSSVHMGPDFSKKIK